MGLGEKVEQQKADYAKMFQPCQQNLQNLTARQEKIS